jgi:hypothetical protein
LYAKTKTVDRKQRSELVFNEEIENQIIKAGA